MVAPQQPLAGIRGREADEEAALRKALDSDDPEIASWAALRLGSNLEWQGDLTGACTCFDLAIERGTGATALRATLQLALLRAHQGDRAAARDGLRAYVVAVAQARNVDMTDSRLPSVVAAFAAGRPRRLRRRYRRARFFASRRLRALLGSSLPARWLGQVAERLRPS